MVKTLDERHDEAELDPNKQRPCTTEAEFRKAAENGDPEALMALAQALIDKTIEHQDPDEAMLCLDKARLIAGSKATTILAQILELEFQVEKRQQEFTRALEMEMMRSEDA